MLTMLLNAALFLLRPLSRSTRRWAGIEWLLGLDLDARERESVRTACDLAGKTLGAYYFWKLTQVAQTTAFRRLGKRDTLALIARSDATDYASVDRCLEDPRGLLLAVPHHGSFVFSIVALAERVRHARRVYVFYEAPKVHATNEVFDVLYTRLFVDDSSGVTILHNNRKGLATAIKQLKRGALVVIMPDVYKDREDTYQVPFCGRSRNVMLGTAVLARRTGAVVLPALSDPSDSAMGFTTRFGTPIPPACTDPGGESAVEELWTDYRTTLEVFNQFERFMRDRLMHWQYCRTHFLGDPPPPCLEEEAMDELSALFLQDPRVRVHLATPMALEQTH